VQRDRQRLGQGGTLQVEALGQDADHVLAHHERLGERALGVRPRGRAAQIGAARTEVPLVLHAGQVGTEGGRMHRHRGAGRELAAGVEIDHRGELVAGSQRLPHHEGAVGPVEVVVQVRAADPHVADAEAHLAFAGFRGRDVFDGRVLGSLDHELLHNISFI
jgi:hypothetical protein